MENFLNIITLILVRLGWESCMFNQSSMAVARNLCVGRQGRRVSEARVTRGSGGMLPQKFLEFKSPEVPFPEAISRSYLILLMTFQVIIRLRN